MDAETASRRAPGVSASIVVSFSFRAGPLEAGETPVNKRSRSAVVQAQEASAMRPVPPERRISYGCGPQSCLLACGVHLFALAPGRTLSEGAGRPGLGPWLCVGKPNAVDHAGRRFRAGRTDGRRGPDSRRVEVDDRHKGAFSRQARGAGPAGRRVVHPEPCPCPRRISSSPRIPRARISVPSEACWPTIPRAPGP